MKKGLRDQQDSYQDRSYQNRLVLFNVHMTGGGGGGGGSGGWRDGLPPSYLDPLRLPV